MGVCVVKGSAEVAKTVSPEYFLKMQLVACRSVDTVRKRHGDILWQLHRRRGCGLWPTVLCWDRQRGETCAQIIVMHSIAFEIGAREQAANFIEPCQAMGLLYIATL